jgi:hypothetical protein
MHGVAGMRSALLPQRAFLDLGRVRFLLRLQPLPGFFRTYALFTSDGGQLAKGHRRVPA